MGDVGGFGLENVLEKMNDMFLVEKRDFHHFSMEYEIVEKSDFSSAKNINFYVKDKKNTKLRIECVSMRYEDAVIVCMMAVLVLCVSLFLLLYF